MNTKNVSWPQAFVIVAVIVAVVLLAILKRDIASFVSLGIAILGAIGLGFGQLSQVKQIVNGNLSRILDILEKRDSMTENHIQMLAAAHVPQSALQPGQPSTPETAVPPLGHSPDLPAGGTAP